MRNIPILLLSLLAFVSVRTASSQLVWSDEFNYTGLPNSSKWAYEVGYVRNQEAQYYTNARLENARVDSGKLIIEGRKDNWSGHEYTSASLTTKNKHSWQYGGLEMRARIDTALGLWPAWWTMGISGSWPGCGEIDIMEYFTGGVKANFFWNGGSDAFNRPLQYLRDTDWSNHYHVWRMDWSADRVNLVLDGQVLNSIDATQTINASNGINPFHQPHYMIANLAMGGTAGGDLTNTPFPARYEVDYIRVYQDMQYDVSFMCTPDSGMAPLSVIFTNTSMSAYTRWLWDFGDGTTDTAKSPTHLFQAAGNFTVKLTGTKAAGGSKTYTYPYAVKASAVPLGISIVSTSPSDPRRVIMYFNKAMNRTTVETAGNYTLSHGLTVVSATGAGPSYLRVDLVTGNDLLPGVTCTLTVNNVQDQQGNTIAPNSWKTFKFTGTVGIVDRKRPSARCAGQGTMSGAGGTVTVYDLQGRTMTTFKLGPGVFSIDWDGKDRRGLTQAAGVYHYTIRTGQGISGGSVVLVR